jgi:hypothetical protein
MLEAKKRDFSVDIVTMEEQERRVSHNWKQIYIFFKIKTYSGVQPAVF